MGRALVATSLLVLAIVAGLITHLPGSQTPAATVDACLNSFDPACGPLVWDPAPGPNAPMTVSIAARTAHVVAGSPVAFGATADDRDAAIDCHWFLFGDEQTALIPPVTIHKQYGHWVPPARAPGHLKLSQTHTYVKPGTYHAQFGAGSGDACGSDTSPYADRSLAVTTVVVSAR